MRYYRVPAASGYRLVADDGADAYDLTAVRSCLDTFSDLAAAACVTGTSIDEVAAGLVEEAPAVSQPSLETPALPVVPEEVWAAGVTYEISEAAREDESTKPEIYVNVYEADRPEIFFKATPNRTVGPEQSLGIRGDSEWNVPEPELGVVLYDGEIVGYTIGNDASSRDIEGQNPLYLPQAKVYDRCCSLGPCVASPETVGDPHELEMTMEIVRDGATVYDGTTSTSQMVRTCEELADYWRRHNAIPEVAVLLTGTSLVPDDDFSLRPDDEVRIEIDRIGELVNTVAEV